VLYLARLSSITCSCTRWNFTVGQYELSLSEGEGVEANTYDYVCSLGPEDWELQIMASEGVITAIHR
jgi:hypothetical protein